MADNEKRGKAYGAYLMSGPFINSVSTLRVMKNSFENALNPDIPEEEKKYQDRTGH